MPVHPWMGASWTEIACRECLQEHQLSYCGDCLCDTQQHQIGHCLLVPASSAHQMLASLRMSFRFLLAVVKKSCNIITSQQPDPAGLLGHEHHCWWSTLL